MGDISDDVKFRWQSISGIRHYNFRNEDEFREFFGTDCPKLVHNWREGIEGDWVIADDGGIVQILKLGKGLGHPRNSPNYSRFDNWCRTVVGTFFIKFGKAGLSFKMDTDWGKHKSRYTFSGTDKNLDFYKKNKRKVLTRSERTFIRAILYSREVDIYKIYKKIYKKTKDSNVKMFCNRLLKEDRIMAALEKEIQDASGKHGLTHEWVFGKLKHFADYAELDSDKLKAVEKIGKALGTFNQSNKSSDLRGSPALELFGSVTREVIDGVSERPEMLSGINEEKEIYNEDN